MYSLHAILTLAAATLQGVGAAALPVSLQTRSVSTESFDTFNYYVQYAAASYCKENYASEIGTKISCHVGNCPLVEASKPSLVVEFQNTPLTDTTGFIAIDDVKKAIVLTFRGSSSVRNWVADATFPYTDSKLCPGCSAESGFWSSWQEARETVLKGLQAATAQHPDHEVVVVGHSLGAAVATLAAADLRTVGYETTLYAFASPRVANPALATFISAQKGNYRLTHTDDPVPKLPLLSMGYVHISPEYFITSPTNVTVAPTDIEVLTGDTNLNGNTGEGLLPPYHFAAHKWYFEEVDKCLDGQALPFRR